MFRGTGTESSVTLEAKDLYALHVPRSANSYRPLDVRKQRNVRPIKQRLAALGSSMLGLHEGLHFAQNKGLCIMKAFDFDEHQKVRSPFYQIPSEYTFICANYSEPGFILRRISSKLPKVNRFRPQRA